MTLKPPPLVISIQSQVVHGHVGNSAAVFPMQAAGLEVAAIPTVLLSNTPHYPTLRGGAVPADLFADLLLGARDRGLPARAQFLVTGYIGSAEIAALTADFIAEAKRENPALTYLCDPVLGDDGPGIYVPDGVVRCLRDRLVPKADIATPNAFEYAVLSGAPRTDAPPAAGARRALGMGENARLVVTGGNWPATPAGTIESIVEGPGGRSRHAVARLDTSLVGTGDLFAALIVAACANGRDLPAAVDWAQGVMSGALGYAAALGRREVLLTEPAFRQELLSLPGA